jgi:hypothetical protein
MTPTSFGVRIFSSAVPDVYSSVFLCCCVLLPLRGAAAALGQEATAVSAASGR